MKVKIGLLCLSFCFAAVMSMSIREDREWENFKKKFEKTYDDSEDESTHYDNFKKNYENIKRHNELYKIKKVSYELDINQFADLNENDFLQLKGPTEFIEDFEAKPSEHESKYDVNVPDVLNWTRKGISSEVKDKGECISDWAFAAAGMLEGYSYIKTNQFKALSEQDLIECSQTSGNNGCDGGYVEKALKYVQKQGIATEASYPFKAEVEKCRKPITRDGIPKYEEINYKETRGDEGMLKYTVFSKGPIAAKIFASPNFFFYKGGIFTGDDCKSKEVDYNVLIVGYGFESKTAQKYWIVKNWWGNGWGEHGYARIERNNNTCGIASKIWC